jgi:hypothetical protein
VTVIATFVPVAALPVPDPPFVQYAYPAAAAIRVQAPIAAIEKRLISLRDMEASSRKLSSFGG